MADSRFSRSNPHIGVHDPSAIPQEGAYISQAATTVILVKNHPKEMTIVVQKWRLIETRAFELQPI